MNFSSTSRMKPLKIALIFFMLLLAVGCSGKKTVTPTEQSSAEQSYGPPPVLESYGPPELIGPSLPPAVAPFPSIVSNENDYAIVLGPGGVRAFAHIGVLHELEDREVKFRAVYGLELGALIGALYGNSNANKAEWEIYKFDKDNFLDKGLLGYSSKSKHGKSFERFIEKIFKNKNLESFKTPVFVSFVENNRLKLINKGNTKSLLRVSAAMTGLLDGADVQVEGALDYDRIRETFKGKLLCVDVSGGDSESAKMWAEAGKNCDQTIVVDTSGVDSLNFDAKADLIFKGRAAAQKWFEEGHQL